MNISIIEMKNQDVRTTLYASLWRCNQILRKLDVRKVVHRVCVLEIGY